MHNNISSVTEVTAYHTDSWLIWHLLCPRTAAWHINGSW